MGLNFYPYSSALLSAHVKQLSIRFHKHENRFSALWNRISFFIKANNEDRALMFYSINVKLIFFLKILIYLTGETADHLWLICHSRLVISALVPQLKEKLSFFGIFQEHLKQKQLQNSNSKCSSSGIQGQWRIKMISLSQSHDILYDWNFL